MSCKRRVVRNEPTKNQVYPNAQSLRVELCNHNLPVTSALVLFLHTSSTEGTCLLSLSRWNVFQYKEREPRKALSTRVLTQGRAIYISVWHTHIPPVAIDAIRFFVYLLLLCADVWNRARPKPLVFQTHHVCRKPITKIVHHNMSLVSPCLQKL